MAGSALRRLMAEYKQLTLNPPEGIVAGPLNEENFFEWEALITGPEGTCFEGGVFPARLTFPADYPLGPPKMKFTCDLFHPNIYPDGRVCISILHAPGDDPMGYESSAERWSPVQSVEKILLSIMSMLAEPNDESAANVDAAKTWRDDRAKFDEIANRTVRKSLGLWSHIDSDNYHNTNWPNHGNQSWSVHTIIMLNKNVNVFILNLYCSWSLEYFMWLNLQWINWGPIINIIGPPPPLPREGGYLPFMFCDSEPAAVYNIINSTYILVDLEPNLHTNFVHMLWTHLAEVSK